MKGISLLAALFGAVSNVNGHSWVECTDYQQEITGQDYDSAACFGYPRSWADYGSSTFAQDRGANYQPGGEGATDWCPKTIGTAGSYTGTYSDTYPIASYTAGSTIRIVWPAKNHANYECFGNIPDFAMKIFVNEQVNPSADPTSLDSWSLIKDWHADNGKTSTTAEDGIPFTNCPDFCSNTDGAVCYGDMEVDGSFFSESGYYTFMWYWAFNGDDDIYSMCWEAYVDTSGTPTNIEDDDTSGGDNTGTSTDVANGAEYLVQIPICYTGSTYDETAVLAAAESLFSDYEWSVDVIDITRTDGFNITLQTHTSNEPKAITIAAENDDHEFCDAIATQLGDTTYSCSSCTDVLVYSTNEYSASSGDDSGSAVVAVVIVLVIVVLIIGAGIGYQKMQEKKGANGTTAGATAEHGMTQHIGQTNTAQAIQPVHETR